MGGKAEEVEGEAKRINEGRWLLNVPRYVYAFNSEHRLPRNCPLVRTVLTASTPAGKWRRRRSPVMITEKGVVG